MTTSLLDTSAVRLAIARRLATMDDQTVETKLMLLRRLQRRHVEHRLPDESESQVEQSFNEQLFAKVLGYQTLFSHDTLPYHLRPKNYVHGRYDDFSLGFFGRDKRDDIVLATAELKKPGTNLDARQTDRKDKITPVKQAFRVARRIATCQWVIVSNFRDLRLYHIKNSNQPLISLDLHEIRTRQQLATLCAHFDHDALLRSKGTPDMTLALTLDHPSAPISSSDGKFRIIFTFTPHVKGMNILLCNIYDTMRDAIYTNAKPHSAHDILSPEELIVTIENGWCMVEHGDTRLSMSVEGQVRWSALHPTDDIFWSITREIGKFMNMAKLLSNTFRSSAECRRGILSVELREMSGVWLIVPDDFAKGNDQNGGIADANDVFAGDFDYLIDKPSISTAALCMGEIAIHFKNTDKRRARFDRDALIKIWTSPPAQRPGA